MNWLFKIFLFRAIRFLRYLVVLSILAFSWLSAAEPLEYQPLEVDKVFLRIAPLALSVYLIGSIFSAISIWFEEVKRKLSQKSTKSWYAFLTFNLIGFFFFLPIWYLGIININYLCDRESWQKYESQGLKLSSGDRMGRGAMVLISNYWVPPGGLKWIGVSYRKFRNVPLPQLITFFVKPGYLNMPWIQAVQLSEETSPTKSVMAEPLSPICHFLDDHPRLRQSLKGE